MENRAKKAENSQHLHSTELKRIYSSNNKKIEINKIYYFEICYEEFFENEKKILIKNHQNSKKSNLNNVIFWIPSSVQILN